MLKKENNLKDYSTEKYEKGQDYHIQYSDVGMLTGKQR